MDHNTEDNPLIDRSSTLDTLNNVAEAMDELLVLLSPNHNGLTRLMSPLLHALEYVIKRST